MYKIVTLCGGALLVVLAALYIQDSDRFHASWGNFSSVEEYKKASALGFTMEGPYSAYLEQEEAKQLGFETVESMRDAEMRGFNTASIEERAAEIGFDNMTDLEAAAEDLGFVNAEAMLDARARGFANQAIEATAAKAGFDTYDEYQYNLQLEADQREAEARGFDSVEAMKDARSRGFSTQDLEAAAAAAGFSNQRRYAAYLEEQEEIDLNRRRLEQARKTLEDNKNNAEWMSAEFQVAAGFACRPLVENLANYSYEWTDGWLDTKFGSYSTVVREPYILRIYGDKIKFQNGFGAWRNMTYYCDYDVRSEEAVSAGLQ